MQVEEEKIDINMQMLAWQTALLMPEDLYKSIDAMEHEEKEKQMTLEDKKKLQEELCEIFNINNV